MLRIFYVVFYSLRLLKLTLVYFRTVRLSLTFTNLPTAPVSACWPGLLRPRVWRNKPYCSGSGKSFYIIPCPVIQKLQYLDWTPPSTGLAEQILLQRFRQVFLHYTVSSNPKVTVSRLDSSVHGFGGTNLTAAFQVSLSTLYRVQ